MATIQETAVFVAGELGGTRGKLLAQLSSYVVSEVLTRREARKRKMDILCRSHTMGWQYNKAVLDNFVKRRFTYYGFEETVGIRMIQSEIKRQRHARNIILTGPAGSGKSTALKWLFLNSEIKGYTSLYLHAGIFNDEENVCKSLQDILVAIEESIEGDKANKKEVGNYLVFFDGLDELNCLQGTSDEFDELIKFFNKKSRDSYYRFVISTRPEHFSFQEKIKNKHFEESLDNYAVFEIQMLTKRESLLVCKSIAALSKYEKKELKGTSHFADKWPTPSKDKTAPSKKEYLWLLKEYLRTTTPETSLLRLPLLCRYAYPIIREWNMQGRSSADQANSSQSAPIQYALASYIKWEFHDSCSAQTEEGKGKTLLANYEKNVFGFLTQIAGTMGVKDYISKKEWENQRKKKKVIGNAAFCALQECNDGKMKFIHPAFRDYFLAVYYAKTLERSISKRRDIPRTDFENLTQLLRSNSEFSVMYAEQLAGSKNLLIKRVISFLMQGIAGGSFSSLAKLVKGNSWYMFASDAPFTIGEYLRIFPHGGLKYNGIFFNKEIFEGLLSTGILEVENAACLSNCTIDQISAGISIKGVVNIPVYGSGFKHTTCRFYIVDSGNYIDVGGYWRQKIFREDLTLILRRREFQEILSDPTATTIQKSTALQAAWRRKRFEDEIKRFNEEEELHQRIKCITTFMGSDKVYWCLFDEGSLFVYQIVPENEKQMNKLFHEGLSKNSADYLSLYGEYVAIMESNDELIQRGRFCETKSLSLVFDASRSAVNLKTTALRIYYSIHWQNLKLLKIAKNADSYLQDDINYIFDICQILNQYEEANEFLQNFPNEKLELYLSDERLITLYATGDGDNMVTLAEETLELCKKYQHQKGVAFRNFLIADDTGFIGKDFEKVVRFAQKYIWL